MRIRTIKPEFWMNEGLAKCSEFSRLLAIALLNWADDEGYFPANPVLIRGQLFPFQDDSKTIPRSIQELSSEGYIELGTDNEGRAVGRIVNFKKHQRVDKPKPSSIKGNSTFQDSSKIHPRHIQDASKEEGNGREGNGKERETKVPLVRSHAPDEKIELIWKSVPSEARARSTQKKLHAAWSRIPKTEQPPIETLIQALDAWNSSQQWLDGYAAGCHIWVSDRKWEVTPPIMSNRRIQRHASRQEDEPTDKFMGNRQLNLVKIEA